nr:MAG TPA: hypothetical protein [Bacteriophage sp.]
MIVDFFKTSHLIGISIITILAVYSYYLSWKIDHLKYELANKDVELNLAKTDKQLMETKMDLWKNKLKEVTLHVSDKINMNDKIQISEMTA